MSKGKPWGEYGLTYLRENWPQKSEAQIASALGRSENAVKVMRYKLNLRCENHGWTQDDIDYLVKHWKEQTDEELSKHFGKSASLIQQKRNSLKLLRREPGFNRSPWKAEEIEYLCENWGHASLSAMVKKLGRTENAILTKKNLLGLGAFLDNGEYVTMNQLFLAVTGSHSYSYQLKSWVENRGFPLRHKRVNECRFRIVYIDEFWEWAEKNRSFVDFSKMEPLALGKEPDWVPEQRAKDFQTYALQRKDPWTPAEDGRLKMLLKQHRYGYAELSEMLRRSAGAIQRRCSDLGLKERPVKADNRQEWTDDDLQRLADGIRSGESYTQIGRAVGRSEKAVRGKVYYFYLTENADKIRAMMGNGPWGTGAPEPTVKQAVCLSRTRTDTKKDLSRLVKLLCYRRNELGYEPYWQRHMCMKWHDIKGCTAECDNCDTCIEFERIRPQYCARCGGTFFERQSNRFCASCRQARKKEYQRKWARANCRAG